MRGPHVLQALVDEVSCTGRSVEARFLRWGFQNVGTDGALIECPSQPWFGPSCFPVPISKMLTTYDIWETSSKLVGSSPQNPRSYVFRGLVSPEASPHGGSNVRLEAMQYKYRKCTH